MESDTPKKERQTQVIMGCKRDAEEGTVFSNFGEFVRVKTTTWVEGIGLGE